jgi:N-acetylneuraminic acid mutarotase
MPMRKFAGAVPTLALILAFGFPGAPARAGELSFNDRVEAQAALERVYYAHQIGARGSFEEAVPRAMLERKVRLYLKQSAALERFWNAPITGQALRLELARMARETRMPERLAELYAALGHDTSRIEECLVRPALAGRLVRRFQRSVAGASASYDDWWSAVETDLDPNSVAMVAQDDELPAPAAGPDSATSSSPVCPDAWDGGSSVAPAVPDAREGHTAVWTGTEVIVWGGSNYLGTGWRYDPATDTWTPTSTSNAPLGRYQHTAVWTDSVMIVWGGETAYSSNTQTGGRYDPRTDTWTPTSTTNAPSARKWHAAVWTGSKMIVWGGATPFSAPFNSGGQYDPATDTWTATSQLNAPQARYQTTAVWTGSQMIVWGGKVSSETTGSPGTGGRYSPATDTWTATSTVGAPLAKTGHTAVWTGSRMVIWGGFLSGNYLSSGARYDPIADSWTPTSTSGAPAGRSEHTAIWTGSMMVVWGGTGSAPLNSGGRYDPVANTWSATNGTGAPAARYRDTAIWTGSQMVVWGGHPLTDTGGRYDPANDVWTPTAVDEHPPVARTGHQAIWTGSLMVVWGGSDGAGSLSTGARYDPATDVWTPTTTVGAPSNRPAVWTGNEMIVWGGYSNCCDQTPGTGARYDPIGDAWTPTSTLNAPEGRANGTLVWTGQVMIVYGGEKGQLPPYVIGTGGRYDPTTDTWTAIAYGAGSRAGHTAVWSGTRMIVWGGYQYVPANPPSYTKANLTSGTSYDPVTNSWTPIGAAGEPTPRYAHLAVWTGSSMVIWGGVGNGSPDYKKGGVYDSGTNSWHPLSSLDEPSSRSSFSLVWTGTQMILWGGVAGSTPLNSGARYDPAADQWTPTSTSGAPQARYSHSAVWTGSQMIVWGGSNGLPLSSGGRYAVLSVDGDSDGIVCSTDCNDADPALGHAPEEVHDVVLVGKSPTVIHFTSQDGTSGSSTLYDVVSGDLPQLAQTGNYSGATCLGSFSDTPATDSGGNPAAGVGRYYLVRARNACTPGGPGTYGDSNVMPDPRDGLDAASPCP